MGLIFDGVDIEAEYCIVVDGADTWAKPARDRELTHVPGRSGDLIYDNGSWHNVNITYHCFIHYRFKDRFEAFCDWLYSHYGYYRFEDQRRHPGVYRMAEFAGPLDPDTIFRDQAGKFDLVLNCKPQQWLNSGEIDVGLTYTAWVRGNYTKGAQVQSLPVWDIDGFETSDDGKGIATPYIDVRSNWTFTSALRVTNNTNGNVTVNIARAYYTSNMVLMTETGLCQIWERTLARGESLTLDIPDEGEVVVDQGERYRRYSVQCARGLNGILVECAALASITDPPDWQHYEESSTLITNGTNYPSRPIIEIDNPTGVSFAINDYEIDIGNTSAETIIIDCELEDCYSYSASGAVVNENGNVSISCSNPRELSDFPYLVPGDNVFHVLMGIDSSRDAADIVSDINIKPNWYRI